MLVSSYVEKGEFKNMKKTKIVVLLTLTALSMGIFTGCSFLDEAKVASRNISKEADNFNVYRKITVINNQTDMVMLEFEGWSSIVKDNNDNQLEITYRVGEDQYYKDFIGLNDRTSYVVTQIDGSNVDKYHYEWLYHSEGDLIPIDIIDDDTRETPENPTVEE